METVSILTAAYNAAATIGYVARSVLAQTWPHWEWIIASDDGSDYEKILRGSGISDARIRVVSTGRIRSGECVARNTALDVARGDILAVLDADDAFVPEKLETLVPRVLEHGAATSDVVIVESASGAHLPSLARKFPAGLLTPADYITANLHSYSLLMWDRRRASLRWDETIALAPDMIHGLCAYNTLPGIWYSPAPLHHYYKHPSSMTNEAGIAARFAENYRVLLERVRQGTLPVKNPDTIEVLKRFLPRMIALEEQFLDEGGADPSLGFYRFIERHRDAFYFW